MSSLGQGGILPLRNRLEVIEEDTRYPLLVSVSTHGHVCPYTYVRIHMRTRGHEDQGTTMTLSTPAVEEVDIFYSFHESLNLGLMYIVRTRS